MTDRSAIRVGVLFGGKSGEHEVSLASARNVLDALAQAGYTTVPLGITTTGRWLVSEDPMARLSAKASYSSAGDGSTGSNGATTTTSDAGLAGPLMPLLQSEEKLPAVDVIFPVLHGPFGEDGTVQGLLEMAGLPYVGCGVLASATGMDKIASKLLFKATGLPQVPYRVLLRRNWQAGRETALDDLEIGLTYPLFVKPANLGSSVGISKARNREELGRAIDLANEYDRKVVVEQGVEKAREIEVSVLGNDEPIASVPGEIIPGNEFYDYAAKYLDDNSDLLIPAPLPPEQTARVQELAVRAFRALDCAGLARVDFLLGPDGDLFLNELNTMPGFTRSSMYPKLWEASGLSYPELVHRLVQFGLERHHDRQCNRIDRTH